VVVVVVVVVVVNSILALTLWIFLLVCGMDPRE
jgi:hypothetical protein